MRKNILAICIVLCLVLGVIQPTTKTLATGLPTATKDEHKDYTNADLEVIIQNIISWKKYDVGLSSDQNLLASGLLEKAGTSGGDWYAMGLGRLGVSDDYISYLAVLEHAVETAYQREEKLDRYKATEWHRIALTAMALGGDPTRFGQSQEGEPINLIKDGTYDRGRTMPLDEQGVNGAIWGLLTVDANRYQIPSDAADDRTSIINMILEYQLDQGGFSLDGGNVNLDITAMALQALAPYYNDEKVYQVSHINGQTTVREAVDRSLKWLSEQQADQGYFSSWGQSNSECTAQVMVALCSLGIDPVNDPRFIKNGNSVLDGLLSFLVDDGGVTHSYETDDENPAAVAGESNSMASEQTLYALCALYRFRTGQRHLYDMRDVQSEELKNDIAQLREQIHSIAIEETDVSSAQLETLAAKYMELPEDERFYVYNYTVLRDLLAEYNLAIPQFSLVESPGATTVGGGTVVNIFDQDVVNSGLMFNETDLETYKHLPDQVTGEHYTEVIRLRKKLEQAENVADYPEILTDLEHKEDRINEIRAQIERINGTIVEKLYPFDDINEEDRDLIDGLLAEVEELSECDRAQILGYEDLQRAKALVDSSGRRIAIAVIAVAVVVILIAILVVRKRKKKRAKIEQEKMDHNPNW
ncbi:MAG: hypothetical protein ACOYCB_07370 [Fastidiosipilaceae bacterium]|nr:hypothetical protein [Clostridiaceae bacterium]